MKRKRIHIMAGISVLLAISVTAAIVVYQQVSKSGPGIHSLDHCFALVEDVTGHDHAGTIDDGELKRVYETLDPSVYSAIEGRTYGNGLRVIVLVLKYAEFTRMDENKQIEYLDTFYRLTQDHFVDAKQSLQSASAGGYKLAIIGTDVTELRTKIEGHLRGMSMEYLSRLPIESNAK